MRRAPGARRAWCGPPSPAALDARPASQTRSSARAAPPRKRPRRASSAAARRPARSRRRGSHMNQTPTTPRGLTQRGWRPGTPRAASWWLLACRGSSATVPCPQPPPRARQARAPAAAGRQRCCGTCSTGRPRARRRGRPAGAWRGELGALGGAAARLCLGLLCVSDHPGQEPSWLHRLSSSPLQGGESPQTLPRAPPTGPWLCRPTPLRRASCWPAASSAARRRGSPSRCGRLSASQRSAPVQKAATLHKTETRPGDIITSQRVSSLVLINARTAQVVAAEMTPSQRDVLLFCHVAARDDDPDSFPTLSVMVRRASTPALRCHERFAAASWVCSCGCAATTCSGWQGAPT